MKILVIGSGGREHAIAWKLAFDERVEKIFIAPGNGGTSKENKCANLDIKINDIPALIRFAKDGGIDLTIVGPEDPLSKGIVDEFEKEGLLIFGPFKAAAQIEASKSFAKDIMLKAGIPTAAYEKFSDYDNACDYVKAKGTPIVIKADGLAAGKGVTVALSIQEAEIALKEIFLDKVFGNCAEAVIEEFMEGEEATYLAITDGKNIIPLDVSQDHKQAYDGDMGPNTGGMGAYSPVPIIDKTKFDWVTFNIAYPMIKEMEKRGSPYKGVIYAGLMVQGDTIRVVEFNCRFGDPECEVVIPRIKSGFLDVLIGSAKGNLNDCTLEWDSEATLCVILASGGYPKSYKSGYEIKGLDNEVADGVKIFHAGTKIQDGKTVTAGGRVLCVTATSNSLRKAIEKAYKMCGKISWTDMHYRKDIGAKALKNNN